MPLDAPYSKTGIHLERKKIITTSTSLLLLLLLWSNSPNHADLIELNCAVSKEHFNYKPLAKNTQISTIKKTTRI